jgi:DNA-binding MarR family transcriptional regulator
MSKVASTSNTKTQSTRAASHKSGPTEPLELPEWVPYRCSAIANHVSACLESMYGKRYGLSVVGWRVMAVLGSDASLSATQVAEQTAMDPVQVTRTINHLTSLSLLSRRVDKEDRRRVVLNLSKKGWSVYNEIVPVARGIERALLASFSPQERQQLQELTGKLLEAAERILPLGVDWRPFVTQNNSATH